MQKIDFAAYVWPSYYPDERARIFWPQGIGEWQTVASNRAKFNGHSQPRRPLWGYLNESDPYVMAAQIDAARDHGINVFIYDWYWYDQRPFLEECLNSGFLGAKNRGRMKFYVMWANHDANGVWDKRIAGTPAADTVIWSGGADKTQFGIICRRLIDKYLTLPEYYTINNCPVVSIYDIDNLVKGLGGINRAARSLEDFRGLCVKAGLPGLHLQAVLRKHSPRSVSCGGGHKTSQQDAVEALGFDSITHYQYCHFTNIDRAYPDIMKDVKTEWETLSANYTMPYFPHVSVGWDNNPRFEMFRPGIVQNNPPPVIEQALRDAVEFTKTHPLPQALVTLNSWNEWTETSYLQPDDLYGYGYLEAVRNAANQSG